MPIDSNVRPSLFNAQPIVQGSYREILFNVFSSPSLTSTFDISGASIQVDVKSSRMGSSIFTKKNDIAGGSDSEIKINAGNISFTIYLSSTDTNLTLGEYIIVITIIKASKTFKILGNISII